MKTKIPRIAWVVLGAAVVLSLAMTFDGQSWNGTTTINQNGTLAFGKFSTDYKGPYSCVVETCYNVGADTFYPGCVAKLALTSGLNYRFAQDTVVTLHANTSTTGATMTIHDSINMAVGAGNGMRLLYYGSGTATQDTLFVAYRTESYNHVVDTAVFSVNLGICHLSKYECTKVDSVRYGTHTASDSNAVYAFSDQLMNVRPELLANDSTWYGVANQYTRKVHGKMAVITHGYAKCLVYADSTTGVILAGEPLITKVSTGALTAATRLTAVLSLHYKYAYALQATDTSGIFWVYLP